MSDGPYSVLGGRGWWVTRLALGLGLGMTALGCAKGSTARAPEPSARAEQTIVIEVVGNSATVDGRPIGNEAAKIRGAVRRSGYYNFLVRGDAQIDDATLGTILEAAQSSHPPELRLEVGELRAAFDMSVQRRASTHVVVSMARETAELWKIDRDGTFEELGTWQVGDARSDAEMSGRLQRACASVTCQVSLEVEATALVLPALTAWTRISASTGTARTSFIVMKLHQGPPRASVPPAQEQARSATRVAGRLPPPLIQAVVRAHFGDFRACYEAGLKRHAELTGRVSVRFVIGRDGSVSSVTDGGSSMPDDEVRVCVLKAFYVLRFPQPDGGIVTVVYPIQLAPG